MEDIKLLEKCEKCGAHLTLMESQRHPDGTLWAVKRCLNCGGHHVEEVARLHSVGIRSIGKKPSYKIVYDDGINGVKGQWTATEKHPDDGTITGRMEFYGYGDTPEAALNNISNAHESFGKAMSET